MLTYKYLIIFAFLWVSLVSVGQGSETIGKFDRVQIKSPRTLTDPTYILAWDSVRKEVMRTAKWEEQLQDTLSGGAITSVPSVAYNPGTNLTVAEWIRQVFYPFVSATLTLSGSNLYEVGTTNTRTLTITITPNSETVFTSGYLNRTSPLPATSVGSWGSGSSVHTVNVTFSPIQGVADSATKIFRAYELVGNNGSPTTIQSGTATLESCYPYFYGMSASDLSSGGNDFYNAFGSARIVKKCASTTTVVYNTSTLKYAYFSFPTTCNSLSNVKDQNLYDWTNNFQEYLVTITGPNWSTVSYKLYRSNSQFTTEGNNWTFTFTQ